MVVPRIERIVRGIARSVGPSVTKSPGKDGSAGGVLGLGAILWKLRGIIPEASWRYLSVLLTRETSINIRNRLSHGLTDEVSQQEAVLLIHACCHLAGFTIASKPESSGDDGETP